ncbi:Major facilitator superfamily domain general substrate transporter [Penicillium verhagenii]|uniref:Major facilitator superfamily domain general substrate transporter n=1 Tax=Penicillium verhagenii TaxID=1562060 RepID=UPI002545044A|nr:Major facilitator superfamily domain general substrate transporter [Penicillium verhagenii]KAJ5934682.1 Major facilitator superfamily domain general substrate transporter [Penicillium verhagenii]
MGSGEFELPIDQARSGQILKLPNEILHRIAILLPHDYDIIKLALANKEMKARILGQHEPNTALWRVRFKQTYDLPQGRSSQELMVEYQTRMIVLGRGTDFRDYSHAQQKFWLEVFQTMISEVIDLPWQIAVASKTYQQIQNEVCDIQFLSQPNFKGKHPEAFCAVQLALTALALDSTATLTISRGDYNIRQVYTLGELQVPFIDHRNVNLSRLLDMRSFWMRHLMSPDEHSFHESFNGLADMYKPRALKTDGSKATDLSKSWTGYFSCLHPMPVSFDAEDHRETCADGDSHLPEVDIQTLEIKERSSEPFWPAECNAFMPRCVDLDNKRIHFTGFQNVLRSSQDAANPIFGFVEPIETPCGGIPGWSRICFTICERPPANEVFTWPPLATRWIHGYEAIILPGGRLMLGLWIDLQNPMGRGPFIYWDV